MVPIPSGTFIIGSPSDEVERDSDEGPQTTVTITRPFWMSKYEVTQAQYRELKGNSPSLFRNAGMNAAVEQVSWNDAVEYCRVLTEREHAAGNLSDDLEYRLPTEAQWEYACRAGTTTRFSFGDDPDYTRWESYAWLGIARGSTHPVGQKLPNPWGLHDVHGNVWEWCSDWLGNYPGGDQVDPAGPDSGTVRVARGGGWNTDPWFCRSAKRFWGDPSIGLGHMGFRPVLDSILVEPLP